MDDLPEDEKPGIPGWVVTFADLMSLLMCFFVLLLSFSEIDAQKFKQIAGELSKAFGVQREVPALEIPQGTSPIFDRFSPAPPEPTVLEQVRQTTTTEDPRLETLKSPEASAVADAVQEQMDERVDRILTVLEPAVVDGRINVSQEQARIIIRIEEKGSFPSASADVTYEFEGLLLDMAPILADMPGNITIEGHTDDLPINTSQFASNWNLSAARAAAVANVLLAPEQLGAERIRVTGMADTEPRVPNTSTANRAKNRRVEIIIDLADDIDEEVIRLRELMGANPVDDQPFLEPTIEPGPASDGLDK
ncbi:MotB family protein [Marinobacter confluentis]|uniref:Type VI secretion system protein TssL n=1 Tax=Marinobacter confluentis TaxID=1697557 RepID=A0A4Z1BXC8_9GAMM|nr:MotB family protein [Marinobacter confluentis]TGN39270.1 type VI secretion system protein TssL [Marinobacter confluentis]